MAFVLIDLVFNHTTALTDRVHHLLRFFLGATGIVAAREQIQRRLDLVHEVDGRPIFVERLVLLGIAHGREIRLLQHGVFVLNLGKPVDKRHNRNARRPQLRSLGDAHHRQVATITATHQN